MLTMSIPVWEFILRATLVYGFLIILLRVTGKRQVGQLAPFDLVLLLLLSNAVQDSVNGGDNSLVGGMISAATLVSLNFVVAFMTHRSKRVEALIEGRPQVLIHNGRLFPTVLAVAKVSSDGAGDYYRNERQTPPLELQVLQGDEAGGWLKMTEVRDKANEPLITSVHLVSPMLVSGT